MPAERPEQLDPGDRIGLSRVPADHLVAGLPDQIALRGIVRMLGSLLQIRIDTIRVEKARLRSSPQARRSSMSMITPGRSAAAALFECHMKNMDNAELT
jgi:hypothetical protein